MHFFSKKNNLSSNFFMNRSLLFLLVSLYTFNLNEPSPLIRIDNLGNKIKLTISTQNNIACIDSSTYIQGNGWSTPVIISDMSRNVISTPLLEITPFGFAAVWQSNDVSGQINMEAAIYLSEQGWQPPKIISEPFEKVNASDYQLSVDKSGLIQVLWHSENPSDANQLQTRSVGGSLESWERPITISENRNLICGSFN